MKTRYERVLLEKNSYGRELNRFGKKRVLRKDVVSGKVQPWPDLQGSFVEFSPVKMRRWAFCSLLALSY